MMYVEDGGGGDGGNVVMDGGRNACVGSGRVNGRDCSRLPWVIRELWEDLSYSSKLFLKFLPNERDCRGRRCILGEFADVHIVEIFFGVKFEVLFSGFCDCGRFLKE